MAVNIEDLEKLWGYILKNSLPVLVGILIGAGIVSWAYEKFVLSHTNNKYEELKVKYTNLKTEYEKFKKSGAKIHVAQPTSTDNRDPLGLKFALIKSGSFVQGSPQEEVGRHPDEPQFKSTLDYKYRIGITEITQNQFESRMGYNPSKFKCGPNCPVDSVTWHEAAAFANVYSKESGLDQCYVCSGLEKHTNCQLSMPVLSCTGYRLPTESEWEFAARAGAVGRFWLGDDEHDLIEIAWYENNSHDSTQPVALLRPNQNQLYDILGNVWEWTNDWYAEYPKTAIANYIGPKNGTDKINRGGGYTSIVDYHRLANRAYDKPGHRQDHIGFRLAIIVDAVEEKEVNKSIQPTANASAD